MRNRKPTQTVTLTSRIVSGLARSSSTVPDIESFPKNSGRNFGFGERLFTSSVSQGLSLPLPFPFEMQYRCWLRSVEEDNPPGDGSWD